MYIKVTTHTKKTAAQIAHLVFAPTHKANTSAKSKEPFFIIGFVINAKKNLLKEFKV